MFPFSSLDTLYMTANGFQFYFILFFEEERTSKLNVYEDASCEWYTRNNWGTVIGLIAAPKLMVHQIKGHQTGRFGHLCSQIKLGQSQNLLTQNESHNTSVYQNATPEIAKGRSILC